MPLELRSIQIVRFWKKVVKQDGCWIWIGSKGVNGYGHFNIKRGVKIGAHRIAYELLKTAIPEGLEIDHLCRTRDCVNPDHMEPVTHAENMRRSTAGRNLGPMHRAKTHCPGGHPYDLENTYLCPNGARQCRICRREADRRYKASRKLRKAA
jgi:hypothetical protein